MSFSCASGKASAVMLDECGPAALMTTGASSVVPSANATPETAPPFRSMAETGAPKRNSDSPVAIAADCKLRAARSGDET
jgi:hypothetical protein